MTNVTSAWEIATLRAIGFGPGPVVLSVFAEGMILAIPAALLGDLNRGDRWIVTGDQGRKAPGCHGFTCRLRSE
jgi:hypothetical protein